MTFDRKASPNVRLYGVHVCRRCAWFCAQALRPQTWPSRGLGQVNSNKQADQPHKPIGNSSTDLNDYDMVTDVFEAREL